MFIYIYRSLYKDLVEVRRNQATGKIEATSLALEVHTIFYRVRVGDGAGRGGGVWLCAVHVYI